VATARSREVLELARRVADALPPVAEDVARAREQVEAYLA
jgi:hypothetical protein